MSGDGQMSERESLWGTKKQVQQHRGREEEGHLSQMLLIIGELTFRYHHVEVIGNLGKSDL